MVADPFFIHEFFVKLFVTNCKSVHLLGKFFTSFRESIKVFDLSGQKLFKIKE